MFRVRGSYNGELYDVRYQINEVNRLVFDNMPDFNFLKKELPHVIELTEHSPLLNETTDSFFQGVFAPWAKTHMRSVWYPTFTRSTKGGGTWFVCFKDGRDAVLFKLKWC